MLKGLQYPASSCSYEHGPSGRTILPLDPIENAGCLDTNALLRTALKLGWSHAASNISLITDIATFRTRALAAPIENRRLLRTHPKYQSHIRELERSNVLALEEASFLLFCSRYFAVPKNDDVSRSIFNGNLLSKACVPPPGVSLMDAVRVNRMFSDFAAGGMTFGFAGDFRHFFHMILVCKEVSRFFGICCGQTYRWKVLPMGWSFSPAIAQTIGWLLFCGRENGQESLFDESFFSDPCLPEVLHVKEGGLLFLYYDNFLLLCRCPIRVATIRARMLQNLKKYSGLEPMKLIKEIHSLKKACSAAFFHLGSQYRFLRHRDQTSAQGILQWRPKTTPSNESWTSTSSCRELAKRVGRIVYRFMLEDKGLTSEEWHRTVDVIRAIGSTARSSGWDSLFAANDDQLKFLENRRVWLCTNDWIESKGPRPHPLFIIISDASLWGFGWAIIELATFRLVEQASGQWPHDLEGTHIYRLEAQACFMAFHAFIALVGPQPAVLVTDNSALAGTLRRGFSMCRPVQEALQVITKTSIPHEVVQITSHENVTDPHSRGVPTVINAPYICSVVRDSLAGRKICRTSAHQGTSDTVRHPEGDLEDLLEAIPDTDDTPETDEE